MSRARPLIELDPCWVRLCPDGKSVQGIVGLPEDPTLVVAGPVVGVSFVCPSCPCGHRIAIPFQSCPIEVSWLQGRDVRWGRSGETFESLTTNPSINCDHGGPCTFHGWIKNGQVTW